MNQARSITARARCRALPLVPLLLTLAGCGEDAAPGQWPLSAKELRGEAAAGDPGEATYRRYCIGCHGADGRGNGGITGANFLAEDSPLKQHSDPELIASVRDGKRGTTGLMPAHSPVLSEAQIAAVVAYVRRRYGSEQPVSPAQQP